MKYPEIVLETLSEDLEATLQLGYAWISRGSLESARDVFDGLTRLPLEGGAAQQVGCGLIRIGDVLMELVDYPGALIAYRAGLEIRRALTQRDPNNTDWQRKLSLTHDKIGILLEAQGDGRGALAAYSDGLEIRNNLSQRDPNNTEWQRDLSWTLDRIGDVLTAQGDFSGALSAYRAGLEIAASLVQRDPEHAEWQRDLSISHNTIGNALLGQEDSSGALAAYRTGLEIRKTLAQRDPDNTEWQRDLSISHDKIGHALQAQGDSSEALAAYRKSLEIAEILAQRDPDNMEWQHDLSASYDQVGDVLLAQGDCPGALSAYRAGLEIAQSLVRWDPENTEWQRDLSISHNKIGDALLSQEDSSGALAAYRTGLEIRNALTQHDPENAKWQRDLSISHDKIGNALVGQGDSRKARAAYLAGLDILESLARREPQNSQWLMDQAEFLAKLGSLDCLMARNVRRDYLRKSRDILVSLKSQGRSGVNEELIDWLDDALKRMSWRSWDTTRTGLKVVGTGLLAFHIIRNSFTVEPGLVAMYLAIVFSVGFAFVVVIYPAVDWASGTQQTASQGMSEQMASAIKRHPLRLALLIPGEDGIFFVPLLWVGITPLTAGVAAAAFAAVHLPEYSIRACAPKFVFLFAVAMVVLPQGIGSVVVGHLLVDAIAFTTLNLLSADEAAALSPVDTASGKP